MSSTGANMDKQSLISMEHVSKKYCRDLKNSMMYGLGDLARDIFNKSLSAQELRKHEFWSLSDISLCLNAGDVLGIVGSNGAGKSTILKLLSGIMFPDAGVVSIAGKVGELIEIGAGFHPMLTGRENIYIKAAILGMKKNEIDRVFDEIVAFSGLEESIDMPVKYYSNGMYMRLGFSVVVHSRSDILLIDEVLSVGDANFRAKCFNKINQLIPETGTVFVSHIMGDVARICNKILVLDRGRSIYYGPDVSEGINYYYKRCSAVLLQPVVGSGRAILESVLIESTGTDQSGSVLDEKDELKMEFQISVDKTVPLIDVVVTVTGFDQQNIVQANSRFDMARMANESESIKIRVNMGRLYLSPGMYSIIISILSQNHTEVLGSFTNCAVFRVSGSRIGYGAIQRPAKWVIA